MRGKDARELVHAEDPLRTLRERLAPYLGDWALYRLALSHRSYCAEVSGTESNERLEFLGDSVLGVVVTDVLYRDSPTLPEGELAKARATIVSAESLARTAAGMGVGEELLLGRGEESSGGFVIEVLGDRIAESVAEPGLDDHKGRLQELLARFGLGAPRYIVVDTGPDHAKHFAAEVMIGPELLGSGEGRSKKQAEQSAARMASLALRARHDAQTVAQPDA
jgi:ribonuclease-3